jgi:hypothetical protein
LIHGQVFGLPTLRWGIPLPPPDMVTASVAFA